MKKLTIIGGGPAGYAAALYASNFELEITLIESDTLGGTCLNRGCIPAKYWLHVAELNHEIDNSKDFGIEITGKNIDWKATAQKRLDKAKKIADLKKQITTIRNEQISESVGDDAKRLGLTHLGFGRYGKDGKMTHKSDGDKLVKAEPKDIEDYEKKQKAQDDKPTKDEPTKDEPKPSKDPDSVGGANDPNAGRGRITTPGSNKPLDRQVNKFFGDEDQITKEFEDIVDIGRGSNSVFYHGNGTTEITISGTQPGMDDDDAGDLSFEYDNIVGKLEAKGLEMGKDFFIDELEKPDPDSDDDIIIAAMKIRVIPDLSDFESDEERNKFRAKWIEANKKYDYFAKTMGGRQLSFRNTDGNESEKNPNMENEEMNHYITAISKMNEAPVAQKEDLDDKDVDTIKPIIKQLKKSVKAHDKQAKQLQKDIEDETDLEEFTDKQIERLKKEYESLRGKEKSVRPERFAQLRKMMRRFPKANLLKLAKADIPILSSGARASLVVNHGMKFSQIPEDFIPYMEIFADDNKELSEQKKSNFKSVDPKVIDRIEKMMRGTRKEKDSIANMLNYFMPPEVVDMVRYKLKIVPKRGKIKF